MPRLPVFRIHPLLAVSLLLAALVALPVGSVLIPPLRGEWNVPLRTPAAPPRKKDKDPAAPRLYLMGADGGLALPPPP